MTVRTTHRVARAAAALVTAALMFMLPAPAHATVGHGLCVNEIDSVVADPTVKAAVIDEVAEDLRAGWVRLTVSWPELEPAQGTYSVTHLANLDYTVDELHARGVKLVVTFCYVPRWASDSSYWKSPPGGMPKGYLVCYPMRDDALADLRATAQMLAARYVGRVTAYECWNEPNLWGYLYPQRTANDEHFAARTYLKYLKAFSAGVRAGDPEALVVAGATGPYGPNDKYRTSPQKFATFLSEHGAAQYFDVYSHHPYTVGGTVHIAPDGVPNSPSRTVTLYNLATLLRLFPGKPFYLTEYGYNTSPCADFGGFSVTKVQQADFLRRAYAYAGRYKQVKVLFWYLLRDAHAVGAPPDAGVYTGLREADGDRKLSWFAFAGRNKLTIGAPRTARYGALVRISGTLSNAAVGTLPGRTLVLQSRKLRSGSWRTVSSTKTRSAGGYRFTVKPGGSRVYRVVWRGVKTSATRTVRVYL